MEFPLKLIFRPYIVATESLSTYILSEQAELLSVVQTKLDMIIRNTTSWNENAKAKLLELVPTIYEKYKNEERQVQ